MAEVRTLVSGRGLLESPTVEHHAAVTDPAAVGALLPQDRWLRGTVLDASCLETLHRWCLYGHITCAKRGGRMLT